jgi:hypothetical protein
MARLRAIVARTVVAVAVARAMAQAGPVDPAAVMAAARAMAATWTAAADVSAWAARAIHAK